MDVTLLAFSEWSCHNNSWSLKISGNVCKPFASGIVKQKLHQLTEQEKLYGVLKWGMTTSEKTFIGEGKVGDYTLSQDFIDAIRTNSTWAQYDEDELNTAGYAHTQDQDFTQKDFIEPLSQTQRTHVENDFHYFYNASDFKTRDTVTALGIQDGQTLRSVPEITDNLLKDAMDRETAIKQGGVPGIGASVFSIIFSLLLLAGGAFLFVKNKQNSIEIFIF